MNLLSSIFTTAARLKFRFLSKAKKLKNETKVASLIEKPINHDGFALMNCLIIDLHFGCVGRCAFDLCKLNRTAYIFQIDVDYRYWRNGCAKRALQDLCLRYDVDKVIPVDPSPDAAGFWKKMESASGLNIEEGITGGSFSRLKGEFGVVLSEYVNTLRIFGEQEKVRNNPLAMKFIEQQFKCCHRSTGSQRTAILIEEMTCRGASS